MNFMTSIFNLTIKRRSYANVLILMASLLLMVSTQSAHAVTCSGGPYTISVNLPSSVSVPRDAPVGSLLTPWSSTAATTNYWTCSANGEWVGVDAHLANAFPYGSSGYTTSGTSGAPSSSTFTVYNTSVPGVGIAIANRIYNSFHDTIWTAAGNPPGGWMDTVSGWHGLGWSASTGTKTLGAQVSVALIKTGTVSQGGNIPALSVVETGAGNMGSWNAPSGTAAQLATFKTTPVQIIALACTTPDVVVPLGSHSPNEMASIGATTQPVSFKIALNSCPGGMNAIQYRIDPATTVVNSAQSVVALNSGSSASGVAVQLLNSAGTAAFPLSSYQVFSGYSKSTGGSYTIPFMARYYRTGAISPGTANTSMTFTMQYQ